MLLVKANFSLFSNSVFLVLEIKTLKHEASGRQNTDEKGLQPLFAKKGVYSKISLFVLELEAEE